MKKTALVLLLILLCVQVFASLTSVLTEVNEKRYSLVSTKKEAEAFKQKLNDPKKNPKNLLSKTEVEQLLTENPVNVSSLSVSKALEDVDLLFRDLKYGYNGYLIFGGDTVFKQKKAELEKAVRTYGKTISKSSFADEIYSCLSSFITDFHFSVEDHGKLSKLRYCYFYGNDRYDKDSKGYYRTVDGKKEYLVSYPDDVEVKAFLFKDGTFGYVVCSFELFESKVTKNIVHKDTEGRTWAEQVVFEKRVNSDMEGKRQVEFYKEENIAYLYVQGFDSEDNDNPFIMTASRCKDADILIIDLRGNGGGSNSYEKWLSKVFGKVPKAARASSFIKSPIGRFGYKSKYGKETLVIDYIDTGSVMRDDKLVIVLADNNCGSGGDMFVNLLSFKENTLIIGSNTAGCVCFGGYHEKQHLPNSGIGFEFGPFFSSLRLGKIEEGKGVMPDILCDTNTALDATLAMLVKEGRINSRTAVTLADDIANHSQAE